MSSSDDPKDRLIHSSQANVQIVSLDVVAVILAIVGGLVALTNNDYLSSLVEINWYDAFVLIVTGIGIGNLKTVVGN